MDPDIQRLTDKARGKIRGGYFAPHAINYALRGLRMPAEEKEALRRKIAQELNRRNQLRRKKKLITVQRVIKRRKAILEKITREEQRREAQHMARERRDHLLPDP
ncbi:hypothetical protein CL630_03250 [bacterium]|nr:hypothetical protein [bacterium]|tara:strand:+ start:22486 stop:22800 length:315 start_codon:yes stop_codon:yes gene_type:complete